MSASETTMTEPGAPLAIGYAAILARQCRLAPADAGALVRIVDGTRVELLAIHPGLNGSAAPPRWLAEAAKCVPPNADGRAIFISAEVRGGGSFALVPIAGGEGAMQIWAMYLLADEPTNPGLIVERLAATAAGLHMVDAQGELSRQAGEIDRLQRTVTTLAGLAAHDRFGSAAMALCNHAAAGWKCERVSLGLAKGPYIRLAAMSHTERVSARSSLVQELEGVMEECFDQDLEILIPADERSVSLSRAAREFAARHGPMAIASVPIRREGSPIGVLTLERAAAAPFSLAEVATLRLLADAASAQIWLAHRYRRWFGVSVAAGLRSMIAGAFGPSYAWAKLTAIALAAAALFFSLVPGTYRVRGDARVEASDRRVVAGPFDGFLLESKAKAGDLVEAGDLLARLDTTELLLRLGAFRAEQDGALREASLAQRERKDAEAQIARARARRAEAEIRLLERQLDQSSIKSPASGAIVTGDLDRAVGAPVSAGDVLFEIASLDLLLVEVFVSEDQIADIAIGSAGTLATLSRPDLKMPVTVTLIEPMAQVREGRNVFRVLASLAEQPAWLRPGMEGTVRLDAGRRSYPWIWSRRTVNWIRMKLWI